MPRPFFASTHEPYDLIVSEPSNPWVSGVATLFSDEFYGRITHYLAPMGTSRNGCRFTRPTWAVIASVIKALSPHFGAYAIYNVDDVDMLIIATRGTTLSRPRRALLQSPLMRAELEAGRHPVSRRLQTRKIGDNRTIGPLLQAMPVPANSDFFPFVDLNAPRSRYLRETRDGSAGAHGPAGSLSGITRRCRATARRLEPPATSVLFRDGLVRRAIADPKRRGERRASKSGSSQRGNLAHIDMSPQHCARKAGQEPGRRPSGASAT